MNQPDRQASELVPAEVRVKVLFAFRGGRTDAWQAHVTQHEPDDILYGINHFDTARYTVHLIERDDTRWQWSDLLWHPVERLLSWRTGIGFSLPTAVRHLRQVRSADVVVSVVDALGLPLLLLSRLGFLSTPVVYVSQGLSDRLRGHRVWTALYRWLLSAARQVVVLGEGAAADLVHLFSLPADRVTVIPYGVDASYWRPGTSDNHPDFLCSVGNDAARDFETLCQATGDTPLVIVTRRDVPAVCRGPHTTVKTGLTNDALRLLYQRARIVITPLHDVAQPSGQTATLQAMACGVPVILTKTRGLWEPAVMRHGENCWLVEPHDVAGLRQAIAQLLADPELRQRLGRAARQTIDEHYTSTHVAHRFMATVQHALDDEGLT